MRGSTTAEIPAEPVVSAHVGLARRYARCTIGVYRQRIFTVSVAHIARIRTGWP
ncbi:hypothetical protein I553_9084 [Mycobacterium xenopi 4042]|uniref:Uncharacterized protein n=1 Tax=Mycobacterium xenopi 4042 TaxID=1299334 RepID=X8ALV4_MYCXE|nr:hypothetical protein I553_9084 [Mycobacterium xenopi 4042]